MKKKLQVFELRAPLMPRSGGADDIRVRCRTLINLRPGQGPFGTQLRAVGGTDRYSLGGPYTPLCSIVRNGRSSIVCSRGRDIAIVDAKISAISPVRFTSALPAEAHCALAQGSDSALVMTQSGPVKLSLQGNLIAVQSLENDFPPVQLSAKDAGPLQASMGARKLSRAYDGASRLDTRDAEGVSGDLTRAYLTLCGEASEAGLAIQPALARYRLLDASGRVLFTSAPVLLAHSTGAQCSEGIALYTTDRQTVQPYTLSAHTWTMQATFHSAAGRAAEVATCEIYMSSLFHPYLPGAPIELGTMRGSSAQSPFIMATMPGSGRGLGDNLKGHIRRVLLRAAARMDAIEELVAVITNPFGADAHSEAIDIAPSADAAAVSTSLQAALSKAVARRTRTEALLRRPHSFSAATVASEASTTAWAGITVHPFKGYSAAAMAATTEQRAWQGRTVVRFADGSGVSLSESHSTGAPLSLNPLLSYPSPDAREISITVSCAGFIRHFTAALSPDSSGLNSVYAADSTTPRPMAEGEAPATPVGKAAVAMPDVLALAPSTDPLAIDAYTMPGGELKALLTRTGSEQSWEFGRCRFLAAGEGGVYSIAAGEGRRKLSVRRISALSVSSSSALCSGDDGDVFILAGNRSIDGPELFRIGSNGRMKLFAPAHGYTALAYDSTAGELSAYIIGGGADVFCRDMDRRRYLRTEVTALAVRHIGGEAFGEVADGIAALFRDEGYGGKVDIEIDALVRPRPSGTVCAKSLRLCMRADDAFLRLSAEGCDSAGGNPWPLCGVRIEGDCRSPLPMALICRPAQALHLQLEGRVSAGAVFDSIELSYT
ncbi:MAG: hypothetical protein NC418_00855 [Muribaculaceae bacterium]|nr:hypothetical protein [Muribaculaceae bacterium]